MVGSGKVGLQPQFRLGCRAKGVFIPQERCKEKAMSKFALYVPLEAKPGKEQEVADFLRSAVPLVNAEAGTVAWFAIQESPSRFAILHTFHDESGRGPPLHCQGAPAA